MHVYVQRGFEEHTEITDLFTSAVTDDYINISFTEFAQMCSNSYHYFVCIWDIDVSILMSCPTYAMSELCTTKDYIKMTTENGIISEIWFYVATLFLIFWLEYGIEDDDVKKLAFSISFSVRKWE